MLKGGPATGGRGTNIVVIGAGNAALVAALAAEEAGARVTVLEAASKNERGGNSRFSGGIFRFAHEGLASIDDILTHDPSWPMARVTVDPYTAEHYYNDIMRSSRGSADRELTRRLVDASAPTMRWMHAQGVDWELTVGKLIDPAKLASDETYSLPPGGAVRAKGEGIGLMANLFTAAENKGVDIRYGCEALDLLVDGSVVSGVLAKEGDGNGERIPAATVVLASGGFEASSEMRGRYLGSNWDVVKVRGTRFNTGRMLAAALQHGAQAAGDWSGCHAVPLDADAPQVGDLTITDKMSRYSFPYSVMVNMQGDRFVDEGEDEVWLTYAKTGAAIREQPQALAVQIFDRKTTHLLEPRYSTGTPVEADTISELAGKLGILPARLERTIDEFNAAVPGNDGFDPFTKDGLAAAPNQQPPKSNWALPIDEPPFVAYRVACGITFTYGGLKIDTLGRVLDTADRPLPGLFAAGELTGGFFYYNYPAGAGLMRGAVFGRIAGTQASSYAL